MNGIIRGAALLAGFAAVLVAGCCTTGNCPPCGVGPGPDVKNLELYDRCWPERYQNLARREVNHAFAPQIMNGHVLDQTVWNYMFEIDPKSGRAGDRLNAYGLSHLAYLARRRPNPDPHVYLQTAQDIPYNQADDPTKFIMARTDLDHRRVKAVHDFLQAQTACRNLGYDFYVAVHDPAEVGIAAIPVGGNQPATLYRVFGSVPQLYGNFRGILPATAGGGYGTMGGGTGGGSGGGGQQPGGAGSPGAGGSGSTGGSY